MHFSSGDFGQVCSTVSFSFSILRERERERERAVSSFKITTVPPVIHGQKPYNRRFAELNLVLLGLTKFVFLVTNFSQFCMTF